ncbi:hypothetical protein CQA53_05310 [Helicobacter didelphidarum]|uniref:Uncharacterized protein n=1 Tax=Helicobacter didelphidarum TaxID=2040648 RepID=A0A3D8IMR8_9HELI|nr:hypothetical protein [Helicobacter didelphidarum]RDU65871.1 hypothetical protein CQA53_05310 [Helicobacter didelphidarum]
MDTQNYQNDEYYARFLQAKTTLQQCQINKKITSCLGCTELLNCNIRTSYVKNVYENMNKGKSGGFDFN